MPRISGVTFDVYGTLFDWRTVEKVVFKIFEKKGVEVDVVEFTNYWRSKQLFYTHVNTLLNKCHERFRNLTRDALVHTLRRYGLDMDDAEVEEAVKAWDDLEPFPDIEDALNKVRGMNLKIAPLSNGDLEALRILTAKLSIEFDDIFSAELVGVYKPHPKIYEQAPRKWNLKPSEIMHVAGSTFDVIGSKSFGMVTTWVNRTNMIYDEFHLKPDFTVKNFRELVEVLKRIME